MSDTHQWLVQIEWAGEEAVGDILEGDSTWETGPVSPGAPISPACYVMIKNIGTGSGTVFAAFYEYPGTAGERQLDAASWQDMLPGEEHAVNFHATAPSTPGSYPLGVKVWGDAEPEPSFGMGFSAGKFEIPSFVLPVIALAGLLGLGFYLTKK